MEKIEPRRLVVIEAVSIGGKTYDRICQTCSTNGFTKFVEKDKAYVCKNNHQNYFSDLDFNILPK